MLLKVTLDEIEKKLTEELPVTIYRLNEGETHEDIHFKKFVHGWRLDWVETRGTNSRGRLIALPANDNTAKQFKKVLVAFYLSLGFDGQVATLLSMESIKHFWDTQMWERVIYVLNRPVPPTGNSLTDINTLLQKESKLFLGITNNQLSRVLELTDRVKCLSIV